jgi:uncharacterized protein (TIGR03437 family)
MLRLGPLLILVPLCFSQSFPAFRWIQEIGGTGTDSLAGIGTDAAGNVYLAGSTLSANFPTKSATQNHLASVGIYRIDGPGSAYTALGLSSTSSIAVDPQNPSVLLAASSGAGMKTMDGGNTWATLPIPSSTVQAIAIDAVNDQNIYAATTGQSILKSIDGGASWSLTNNGIAAGSPIYDVIADPHFSGVAFAFTGTGFYRTGDGGANWTAIPGIDIDDLSFDSSRPGFIFAFTSPNQTLKSTDDGQTFQPLVTPGQFLTVLDDPYQPRLLGAGVLGIYQSTDGGVTWMIVSPIRAARLFAAGNGLYWGLTPEPNVTAIQLSSDLQISTNLGPPSFPAFSTSTFANGHLYVGENGGHDVFVAKLDPGGNLIYSTYLGGSLDDVATAMTVDAAGDVYVTGTTMSTDFPTTFGAYAISGNGFVFKLNPDGSLGYSTYFVQSGSAIAADVYGSAYLSGATLSGGIPTTPGAYKTTCCSVASTGVIAIFTGDGFVTKFDPKGSTLVYSTYLGANSQQPAVGGLAVSAGGSAYVAGNIGVFELNASGTALLASAPAVVSAQTITLASDGSVYLAGPQGVNQIETTAGAFQSTSTFLQPLPGQGAGGEPDVIVRMDAALKNTLAATYFTEPYGNSIRSLALDAAGHLFVGGSTPPSGLPTLTPFVEAFGPPIGTGFLSELSGDLTTLLFSTYLGDSQAFSVQGVAVEPDGSITIGGSTINVGTSGPPAANVYANNIVPAPPAALRVDGVWNAASRSGGAIAPGETIIVRGAGFGSDAQLLLGGSVVQPLTIAGNAITAVVPSSISFSAATVQVASGSATSNQVLVPINVAAPGLFSADGSGVGTGYILNQDGTRNSQSNPAKLGQSITLLATGEGLFLVSEGSIELRSSLAVFLDGFYCAGVGATIASVPGLPGQVYELTVILPTAAQLAANDPDLTNFMFPPQVGLILQVAGVSSQNGLSIWVTP